MGGEDVIKAKGQKPDPIKIVRGDAPWSAEQYKSVPGDAISKWLCEAAKADVTKKITQDVNEAIDKHPVTNNWDAATKNFNQCLDKIGPENCEKMSMQKVEFDFAAPIMIPGLAAPGNSSH